METVNSDQLQINWREMSLSIWSIENMRLSTWMSIRRILNHSWMRMRRSGRITLIKCQKMVVGEIISLYRHLVRNLISMLGCFRGKIQSIQLRTILLGVLRLLIFHTTWVSIITPFVNLMTMERRTRNLPLRFHLNSKHLCKRRLRMKDRPIPQLHLQ